MSVTGFAVEVDGEILIRTVSDTELAAQINGLVLCFNVQGDNSWSENYVDNVWQACVIRAAAEAGRMVRIAPVIVEVAKLH